MEANHGFDCGLPQSRYQFTHLVRVHLGEPHIAVGALDDPVKDGAGGRDFVKSDRYT